jgi:hypothetical protein
MNDGYVMILSKNLTSAGLGLLSDYPFLQPTENKDGGPLNLIPFGPPSLMCLRLFMAL